MIDHLDMGSSVPLYQQLFMGLQSSISSGEFPPGSRIPTELELSERFSVSRITVRKAITELVRAGFLIKHQGKGTFVVEKANPGMNSRMNNFSSMCLAEGRTPGARFLSMEIVMPNDKERDFFCEPELKSVFRLRRLRTADSLPVALENISVPTSYSFLLEADLTRSLFEIMMENGLVPDHSQREISICSANDEEHRLLDVPINSPLLLVDEKLFGEGDTPIYLAHNIICSESFHLMVV